MKYDHVYKATVLDEWVDYNGHMNVAYYVMAFDHALDDMLETLGLGASYREQTQKSVFVGQSHITYKQECACGESFEVHSKIVGVDKKRLHILQKMLKTGSENLASIQESLCLHVDLNTRKVALFDNEISQLLEAQVTVHLNSGFPAECGGQIKRLS